MPVAQSKSDVVTRELLDERTCRISAIQAAAKELEIARHEAIDAKLEAANRVIDERLHFLNGLRNDVITKTEYNAQHVALITEMRGEFKLTHAELATLKEWKAELRGMASQSSVFGAYVVAVAGWLIGPLIALAIERLMTGT